MTRDVFGRQRADFARVSAFEPLATNRASYGTNSTLLSRRVSNPFILFSVVVDLTVSRQIPVHPPPPKWNEQRIAGTSSLAKRSLYDRARTICTYPVRFVTCDGYRGVAAASRNAVISSAIQLRRNAVRATCTTRGRVVDLSSLLHALLLINFYLPRHLTR